MSKTPEISLDVSAAARALGQMAAKKPKKYSPAELRRRTERLKLARLARWEGHSKSVKPRKGIEPRRGLK